MTVFHDLLLEFPRARAVVGALYDEFVLLLEQETALYNNMRKSDYTGMIAGVRHRVDRVLFGMREMILAALHHHDPAVERAAGSLFNRLAAFGRITRKAYMEAIASVNLLVADFDSEEYAASVALVGLAPWLEQLRERERELERLLEERAVERTRKPRGRLKDARREMDKLYTRMIRRVEAASLLGDGEALDGFIARLEVEIAYFNQHDHHRLPRDISAGASCVVEPLGTLPRTGKAVTPVPVAYYRDGKEGELVELVFARDFSVTYKNNVKPGTADVTLRGKGRYRGLVTVHFNISD
jgi:hypothetical protein